MKAKWYLSNSDNQEKKSYKLLEDKIVYVPVASMVQETEIGWERQSRTESILSPASHLAIMRHNFSNTV